LAADLLAFSAVAHTASCLTPAPVHLILTPHAA
jgi:hypothetical protein